MKNFLFLSLLFSTTLFFVSCDRDDHDDHDHDEYDYHAHIHSPDATAKALGDTIHIEVDFESEAGAAVDHVNVRIYNADDNTEVYSQPQDAHIHEESGAYEWHDNLILSTDNGFSANTNWVIEAKVWGHEDGEGEVSETLQFSITE